MKYLSLFSGIGGFELGIGKRHECVGFSEIDKNAICIYNKHFKHKNYGDITRIDEKNLPDFDLLVGGFPCQSFSIAGKQRGFADTTRGTLFFDICRILKQKRPSIIVLENVKGLLSHDGGATFRIIIETLDELGYDLQWQVLNSKNFGAAQKRERVFIFGNIRGSCRPQVFPITEFKLVCKDPAVTLTACGYGSQRNGTYVVSHAKARRLTEIELERLQTFPDNWTQGLSFGAREKLIGSAVTVNVIKEIFKKIDNESPQPSQKSK